MERRAEDGVRETGEMEGGSEEGHPMRGREGWRDGGEGGRDAGRESGRGRRTDGRSDREIERGRKGESECRYSAIPTEGRTDGRVEERTDGEMG